MCRASIGVEIKVNKMDERSKKVTLNVFVLCFCYIICTFPHVIYSYFDHHKHHLYDVFLGFYWLQYGFNIALYVGQRSQYWNAYKLYTREKIIPVFTKKKLEDRKSVSYSKSPTYIKTPTSKNYVFFNFWLKYKLHNSAALI